MLPYYLVAIFIPLFLHLARLPYAHAKSSHRTFRPLAIFEPIAVLLLIAFSGTRRDVGTDFYLYEAIYQRIDPTDWSGTISDTHGQELGFVILQLLVKSVSSDFGSLLLVCAAITTIAIWASAHLMVQDLATAFFVYVGTSLFLNSLNTSRQALAVSLILLAIAQFPKRKWISLVLALFALSIHSSAIIAIPVIVLLRLVPANTWAAVVAFMVGLAGAVIVPLIPGLSELLGLLNPRYEEYLVGSNVGGFGTYLTSVLYLAIAILLHRVRGLTTEEAWWLKIFTLAPGLFILGTSIQVANRVSDYFTIVLLGLIPTALGRVSKPIAWRFATFFGVIAYMTLYILNYSDLIPYDSWIFGEAPL